MGGENGRFSLNDIQILYSESWNRRVNKGGKLACSQYNRRRMSEKSWLRLILALFVIVGVMYAVVTPVFEASDELWHYPMVRHLADGNPLPVQVFDPAQAGPWKQEASQPPLYYYIGAALTFWVDASDMETVRWENPHVDNGIITNDGNNNLVIHDPALNPWQGTLLAVRIVRIFSVLLSAVTVCLTYLIAKSVVPNRSEIALGATAVTAFMPMFLFISGAVNNDNLIVPLAALSLVMMIKAVSSPQSPVSSLQSPKNNQQSTDNGQRTTDNRLPITVYWLLLGTVIGLAALTKLSGIGLLALAWGTLVIVQWQRSERVGTITAVINLTLKATLQFMLVLLPVLLIAGWWYWRNVQLYDDWRGWTAFIAVLGQRAAWRRDWTAVRPSGRHAAAARWRGRARHAGAGRRRARPACGRADRQAPPSRRHGEHGRPALASARRAS